MRNAVTIMRRELAAYFYSPIAYVVLTLFLLLSGWFFADFVFQPGQESSLRSLLGLANGLAMPIMLVFFLSLLGMRLLSEELRSGTMETLLTAPVTELDIVLGKFLGALAFYLIMIASTLIYPIVLSLYGSVDPLLLVCNYLALILVGALYLSVGLFFSGWTRNQLVAGLVTMVFLLVFTVLSGLLADQFGGSASWMGWARSALQHLAVTTHYGELVRGRLGLDAVMFFVTTTVLFLFGSTKLLEMRRWR